MASRLEVIRSNKGHHKVIHLGFMYTKHKAMGDKIRWRCVQRGAHCKGSIFTSNDFREPRVTVNHNHMPDFNAVEFARSRTMFAERLAMFHPLEVVELNRETPRPNSGRPKQEPRRDATRPKQEPVDSNGYYCPSRDLPSTSSAEGYSPSSYQAGRPSRRSQAPQPVPAPKLIQPAPQQQLKRPVMMKPLAPKPRPVSPPQPPPPPPEVCLRWNSYHSNMQATFPALLNNEQFVDVTLACEGRSIKCHKMILSACSSYFDELLSQNPCQHPIVLMKDLKFWEVQALVEFMYRGEVNVSQDKLPFLLAAAEALQIKGLASPASSTPQHDDDSSMNLGLDSDYLEDIEVPSPSSARRSRKRRTIAAMPVQSSPPPMPASTARIARLHRNNHLAQPSTSGYVPAAQEPPTRKRRLDPPEFDVNHHMIREIKLEPVDIDASSDSMDQSFELSQLTCEPTFQHNDDDDSDMRPQATPQQDQRPDENETTREEHDVTAKPHDVTSDEPQVTVKENGPHAEDEPHIPVQDNQVSDKAGDKESPVEDPSDTVFKPGEAPAQEEPAVDPLVPPPSSDYVPAEDKELPPETAPVPR